MIKSSAVSVVAVVVLAVAIGAWQLLVREADRRLNRTSARAPYEVAPRIKQIHDRLLVADMHSDFLLWRRSLSRRYARGHMDLPRLEAGNVALQVFSVVTKSPWGQNYDRNLSDTDRITPLAVAQAWPISAWTSLLERALYQARRLHEYEKRGHVDIIRTAADLKAALRRRAEGEHRLAGLLAIEGLHALQGRADHVDTLFVAGFRMMAPVHMFDNEVAGSAHGAVQGGLTDLGRRVIQRMEELRITVDLAHASEATFRDVLAMTTRPVVVSHTGVRGTCDNPRNLSDEQLRGIAATGGVVGIGFWDRAVCGRTVRDIVRAIRYTVDLVGVEHVGLGSDFDGTVLMPFDASGMALITEALLDEGFHEEEIADIMGDNFLRVLRTNLPDS